MKSSRRFPIPRHRGGFTLLEMIVSVAVLGLLAALMGQALMTMSNAWQNSLQRTNNFTKARALLHILQQDIQGGVFRSDLACFPGSSMAFYTLHGDADLSAGSSRQLSLVQYALNASDPKSSLGRSRIDVDWNSAMSFGNTSSFGSNTPTQQDTIPGVVGFQMVFVQADGTYSNSYSAASTNPTRAIDVLLAVVDDQTISKLYLANETAQLRNGLTSAITGPQTIRSNWETYLHTGINWNAFPKGLATGLEIYESYVTLPVSR